MKEPPQFNTRGECTNAVNKQLVLGFTETLTAKHLQYFLDTFRKIMETVSGNAETERTKDELQLLRDGCRSWPVPCCR